MSNKMFEIIENYYLNKSYHRARQINTTINLEKEYTRGFRNLQYFFHSLLTNIKKTLQLYYHEIIILLLVLF